MLQKVIDIVKKAAEILQKIDYSIKEKDGVANVVTSNDEAIQQFLVCELAYLIPNCGFYCEENDLVELGKEYTWIIDPIDGTANYTRGIKECVISVGLKHNDEIILGVVYCPSKDELYYASKGHGAYCNFQKINVSNKPFNKVLMCCALCLYHKDYAKACSEVILDTFNQIADIRRFGSCAYELCLLAAGKCDLFFEIRIFPWDYAGAFIILTEAGGVLKGLNDKTLKIDRPTVMIGANNIDNYKKLNDIVYKYIKKDPSEN